MPTLTLREQYEGTRAYLANKSRILFLTTSNRWMGQDGAGEVPKSTALAYKLANEVGNGKVTVLEIPKLNIYPCEGNVSTKEGNTCGLLKARLEDPEKNPTGHHRCWASINNPDDELWKVSKALFDADCVLFFASVRWGQLNQFYQKLIERLTWVENRHTTLHETNLLSDIDAGIIAVGHNWNARGAMAVQKQTLKYYGFRVVDELCWCYQFTQDADDENDASYQDGAKKFEEEVLTGS